MSRDPLARCGNLRRLAAALLLASTLPAAQAGDSPEPASNVESLKRILREVKGGKITAFSACHQVEELRFHADAPEIPQAVALIRGLVALLEGGHARYAEALRQRADELEAGIVTVPPIWDPGRLRRNWIVTAEAKQDIDGDGEEELFIGIRGHRFPGPTLCHLIAYRRSGAQWTLFWESRFRNSGQSQGVYKIEFRGFDGDGRGELLAGVDERGFGTGGGGGSRTYHVFSPTGPPEQPMRRVLSFLKKGFGIMWRGAKYYDEVHGQEELEDLDGDGRRDVLVRYTRSEAPEGRESFWETEEPAEGLQSRPMLREDHYLWRDGRYVLDMEALTADYDRLVAQARTMEPSKGLELCERIEADFNPYRWPSYSENLRLTGEPNPEDVRYVRAEFLLQLGRYDEAFEGLLDLSEWLEAKGKIATKAGVFTYLGRMCEEHFNEPREAAGYYQKALDAGATDPGLARRIAELKGKDRRSFLRPLRRGSPAAAGELSGLAPNEVCVIGQISVAKGWRRIQSVSWSPDGRQVLFCGRKAKGDRYAVFLVGADGRGLRRLAEGRLAAFCGTTGAILVAREVETPEGKTAQELRILKEDGSIEPWPWKAPPWIGLLSVSSDGRFVASALGLCGAAGEGTAVHLFGKETAPCDILVRHEHWDSSSVIIGWRSPRELVLRVCGVVKLYDVEARVLRDAEPSQLGPGRYEQRLAPTGTHIAYYGRGPWQKEGGLLWVARPDGSQPSVLDFKRRDRRAWNSGEPRWSPDGTRLLVVTTDTDRPRGPDGLLSRSLRVLALGRRIEKQVSTSTPPRRSSRSPSRRL